MSLHSFPFGLSFFFKFFSEDLFLPGNDCDPLLLNFCSFLSCLCNSDRLVLNSFCFSFLLLFLCLLLSYCNVFRLILQIVFSQLIQLLQLKRLLFNACCSLFKCSGSFVNDLTCFVDDCSYLFFCFSIKLCFCSSFLCCFSL